MFKAVGSLSLCGLPMILCLASVVLVARHAAAEAIYTDGQGPSGPSQRNRNGQPDKARRWLIRHVIEQLCMQGTPPRVFDVEDLMSGGLEQIANSPHHSTITLLGTDDELRRGVPMVGPMVGQRRIKRPVPSHAHIGALPRFRFVAYDRRSVDADDHIVSVDLAATSSVLEIA